MTHESHPVKNEIFHSRSSQQKTRSRWLAALVLIGFAQTLWAGSTAVPSFAPASFPAGGNSVFTITLSNDAASAVSVSSGQTLTLPANLTFTGTAGSTCTGLAVTAGGSQLTLSGSGALPAKSGTTNGSCTITATVTSSTVAAYSVTLPAAYFTTSDGSNPPGNVLSASVSVTAPVAISIALRSTRGTTTTSWPQSIYNSLFSNATADFPVANLTRFRWVLTNGNPVAMTNVGLAFPNFLVSGYSAIDVIPNSLVSSSLDTIGASGLSAGTTACGGTLTTNPYTLTAPTPTGSITAPNPSVTLAGATIPANGACEVSFLVRWDYAPVSSNVPLLSGGNTVSSSISIPAGAITDAQNITNSAYSISQSVVFTGYMQATQPAGASTSGFSGDTTTMQAVVNNNGQIASATTTSGGVSFQANAGIDPILSQFPISGGGSCPALPTSAWNATTRLFTLTGTFPARTVCTYNIPFTSDYTGPGAYTDTSFCALPNGPDGIPGNADDAYVTLPSVLQFKVNGINGASNTQNCVTYRAVNGPLNANAVQIGFKMLSYTGANTGSIYNGGDGMVQLTLTAPAGGGGVANYSLTTSQQTSANYPKNADPGLSYVPAPSTTCAGAVLTAVVNASYFSISGVNLADGASCTIAVPVVYFANSGNPQFAIQACDAIGTIGGVQTCSAGISPSVAKAGQQYWAYTQSFIPAIANQATAAAQGTIYQFVLNKPAGLEPVENASLTVNLAGSSSPDYGLRATQIVLNTCQATINGVTGTGALPNLASLTITNVSTPDSQTQAGAIYTSASSGQFDPNAFKASTCTIQVKAMPTTTSPAGSDIITGIAATTLYSNNGGNTQVGSITQPVSPVYSLVTGPFTPVTLAKSFSPATLAAGATSTLTVTINNAAGNTIDLTGASLTDNYPAGLLNASPANPALTTVSGSVACSGTVTAVSGSNSLALTNAYIPSGSVCAITANVVTTSAGGVTNTIPGGSFTNAQGTSDTGATVSAAIVLSASIGPVLQFTPATLAYDPNTPTNDVGTLTLSIVNSYSSAASGMALTHVLPSGLQIAGAITVSGTGCSTLTATGATGATSVSIGGGVPASSTCVVTLPIQVTSAPATASQTYTDTLASGALTVTVGGTTVSNSSDASATLTVLAPATVAVSKLISGATTAAPTSGYGMSLACTHSGTFSLSVGTGAPTSQPVQAGDTCQVTETAPAAAPAGYAWGTPTIAPSGSFATSPGTTIAVGVTNPLTALSQPATVTGNVFSPAIAGGTLPTISLTCTPAASGTYPNFTAPTGASCTLGATGTVAPAGYTAGAPIFGGTGIDASAGTFTMPAGGIVNLTVTTPLTGNPQTISVTKTVSGATGGYVAVPAT